MINLHKLALVTAFGAFGVNAEAQTCSTLCDKNFWKSASQAEVATEISKADVNARDADGETALIWATTGIGSTENVKVLLDAGANVNARDADGETALMRAAYIGTAKVLLDAGADVNARDADGETALMWAAHGFGTAENVKVLLDAGADVNERDTDGETALMAAAFIGAAENVKILLDAGADTSVKGTDGMTAWDYAENNEKLKGTDVYWILNEARFK